MGQAMSTMPQEPSSYLTAAAGGPGNTPRSALPEGSMGRQQQHLPPQWPAVASAQPSRLSQTAYPPPLPQPDPGYAAPSPLLGGGMGPLLATPGAAASIGAPEFAGPGFVGPGFPVPAPLGLPGMAPQGAAGQPDRTAGQPNRAAWSASHRPQWLSTQRHRSPQGSSMGWMASGSACVPG